MSTFDPANLVRPHLRELVPYSSARHEFTGQATVMLDANENAFGSAAGAGLHRYPDPGQEAVKQRIGELIGLPADHIFLGNGSDEAIDLLIRLFCEPAQDAIITCPPTYGMYAVSAAVNNVAVRKVPLTDRFQLDVEAVKNATGVATKLLFLCSPNNPTGNDLSRADVAELLRTFPGIVVMDEAYIEFSNTPSAIALLRDHANLVVLRTLSKAWGSAGLRVGMALASPAIIAWLQRIKPPYNIGTLAQQGALAALADSIAAQRVVERIRDERARLATALGNTASVVQVFPSDANFLLVRFTDADALFRQLTYAGVIVRHRGREPGCAGCLRITIGTPEENDRLLHLIQHTPWNVSSS